MRTLVFALLCVAALVVAVPAQEKDATFEVAAVKARFVSNDQSTSPVAVE